MNGESTFGFEDRRDAGRQLAALLPDALRKDNAVILALPRGGVPVAAEVAAALEKPFDLLVVRKVGVPGHEELAMGAIAGGGVRVLNDELIANLGVSNEQIEAMIERESNELARRERLYRGDRPRPEVAGRTVVLVDDGIATGSTMSAAVKVLQKQGAGRIIVAVPVAPPDTVERLRGEADEVFVVLEPESFGAVGRWYLDFSQTTDEEVQALLAVDAPPA